MRMSQEDIMEIGSVALDNESNMFLKAFNIDIHGMVDFIQNTPDSTKIYYTPLGTLINAILLSGQSPSIFIYKKPSETKLNFEVFNLSTWICINGFLLIFFNTFP